MHHAATHTLERGQGPIGHGRRLASALARRSDYPREPEEAIGRHAGRTAAHLGVTASGRNAVCTMHMGTDLQRSGDAMVNTVHNVGGSAWRSGGRTVFARFGKYSEGRMLGGLKADRKAAPCKVGQAKRRNRDRISGLRSLGSFLACEAGCRRDTGRVFTSSIRKKTPAARQVSIVLRTGGYFE